MKYYPAILSVAIVVAGFAFPAQADLIVNIGSTTLTPGGSGTVDVTISGVDQLQSFNLNFTSTSLWSGLVSFTPPAGPELFTDSANYVFKDDSAVWKNLSSFFGAPDGNPVGSAINGGDSTYGGDNVSPLGRTLVATLYLTASPSAMAGQVAEITLDSSSSFTYLDGESNPVDYVYTSSGGTVTIGAAVPEPSSIGLFFGILGVGSVVTRYRARRRHKSCPSTAEA